MVKRASVFYGEESVLVYYREDVFYRTNDDGDKSYTCPRLLATMTRANYMAIFQL